MIDAGPSLRAAARVKLDDLQSFLRVTGWQVLESRDLSLFEKSAVGGDDIEIVLPATPATADDTTRRVADALRTIGSLEGRSVFEVAEEIAARAPKAAVP